MIQIILKVLSSIWRGYLAKAEGMEISTFLWRKPKQVMWGSIFPGGFDFTVSALKHFGHYNFSLVLLVLTDPLWLCHFRSPCSVGEYVGYLPLPLHIHSLPFSNMLCSCLLDSRVNTGFCQSVAPTRDQKEERRGMEEVIFISLALSYGIWWVPPSSLSFLQVTLIS